MQIMWRKPYLQTQSLSGKSAVVKEYVIMEDRNSFVKTVKDLRYVVMGSRSLIVEIVTQ